MHKILLTSVALLLSTGAFSQTSDKSSVIDTDGDGKWNNCDMDSDNDGIIDSWEDFNNNNLLNDDDMEWAEYYADEVIPRLGDSVANYLDLDSDNDGVLDLYESGIPYAVIIAIDIDKNGIIDATIPKGLNGFADTLETFPDSGIPRYTLADTDADGIPDYLDPMSNGLDPDMYMLGFEYLDMYGYGFSIPGADIDKDGIQDVFDTNTTSSGSPASNAIFPKYYTLPATLPTGTKYDFCGIITPMSNFWLNFEIEPTGNNPMLLWDITNNSAIQRFDVERSSNGVHYEKVASISNISTNQYTYNDINPLAPTNFYRIKAVFVDGTIDYSIVRQYVAPNNSNIEIFPNPTNAFIYLRNIPADAIIQIMDMQGRPIITQSVSNNNSIDVSSLTAGSYLTTVTYQNTILKRSIITISK